MFGIGSKGMAWIGMVIGVAGVVAQSAAAVGDAVAQGAAVLGTVLAAVGGGIFGSKQEAKK